MLKVKMSSTNMIAKARRSEPFSSCYFDCIKAPSLSPTP